MELEDLGSLLSTFEDASRIRQGVPQRAIGYFERAVAPPSVNTAGTLSASALSVGRKRCVLRKAASGRRAGCKNGLH
jgi:hypothetical protein